MKMTVVPIIISLQNHELLTFVVNLAILNKVTMWQLLLVPLSLQKAELFTCPFIRPTIDVFINIIIIINKVARFFPIALPFFYCI